MKTIKYNDIKDILYRYPNNLSIKNLNIYNNNSNNKILFDNEAKYYILKPKGKRALLWFTYIEKKIVCFMIFLNSRNINDSANEFFEYDINFDDKLCYNNVLLYGYYLTNICNKCKQHYFIIENVYNYNIHNNIIEKSDYNNNFNYKLDLYNKILPNIENKNNKPIICSIFFKNTNN